MSPTLTEDDVRRIAELAHLELTPDEVTRFAGQLAGILSYAGEITAVDTAGVEPLSHPGATGPVWREDEPQPSLDRATVLAAAPDASLEAGLFRVPRVL